jgi:hypothetical protein
MAAAQPQGIIGRLPVDASTLKIRYQAKERIPCPLTYAVTI